MSRSLASTARAYIPVGTVATAAGRRSRWSAGGECRHDSDCEPAWRNRAAADRFRDWQLGSTTAYESVRSALEIGYRHIDTATLYKNEADVGKAVRDSGVD